MTGGTPLVDGTPATADAVLPQEPADNARTLVTGPANPMSPPVLVRRKDGDGVSAATLFPPLSPR